MGTRRYLEQCMKQRVDATDFVFYDAQQTVMVCLVFIKWVAKFLKDAFCKYIKI
jgi:hypothetical protein